MKRFCLLLAVLVIVTGGCDRNKETTPPESSLPAHDLCPTPSQDAVPGGRLALIVGISQYRNKNLASLNGAANDALQLYEILTRAEDHGGFGFSKDDVCVLLNEQATTAAFKTAFQQRLVDRASNAATAVIYFAGYGSVTPDLNRGESKEWDDVILLQDARTDGVQDFLDDEFYTMLLALHNKTHNISVILDTAHAGKTSRSVTGRVRFQPPATSRVKQTSPQDDSGEGFTPDNLPGVVVFEAARYGSAAIEKDGNGVFTRALLRVLSQSVDPSLSAADVARQMRHLIMAESDQIPYFHGDLSRPLFGGGKRSQPLAWTIDNVADQQQMELSGPFIPGIGVGAEMRVFGKSLSMAQMNDPAKSKGTLVIVKANDTKATARMLSKNSAAGGIQSGDLALLLRPSDESITLRLRLREASEHAGISNSDQRAIHEAVDMHPNAKSLVEFVAGQEDFELSRAENTDKNHDAYVLRGAEGRIRNEFKDLNDVKNKLPVVLWRHAKQRALLALTGEGGFDYVDQQTLKIQIVPAKRQPKCAKDVWDQAAPNEEQLIPLCHYWQIQVTVDKNARRPLLLGGMLLTSNGDMIGFPSRGSTAMPVQPGETKRFNNIFQATPPVGIRERIVVFGTNVDSPVPWAKFTDIEPAARAAAKPQSALHAALNRYFKPGSRGAAPVSMQAEDSTWTLSTVAYKVEANLEFWAPDTAIINKREYTLPYLDIREYLPADTSSTLYKVLHEADQMATASPRDGYGYAQHDWSQTSDEANLKKGIDCSRAIWFAFTRAGLKYNRENKYLSTAMMVQNNSWMNDEFDRCDDDPNLHTGDVLVFRDATKGDGHTVMVIDPEKRIAWGSHGWDGNAKESGYVVQPDTGVEYQLIKYKKDWQRWDRQTMLRKACFRYHQFIEDNNAGKNQPESLIAQSPCSDDKCPVNY